MSLTKYLLGSATTLLLAAVAMTISVFDAANVDIARPPSLEKALPSASSESAARALEDAPAASSDVAGFIADPLDRYALYQLTRDSAGNPAADRLRLLLLASRRSLRDVEIQGAALGQFLREEKYAQALERLDGMIRANPKLRHDLYDVLPSFTQSIASRQALIDLLALDPPWRKDFFTYLPRSTFDLQTASAVIAAVSATAAPPQSSELAPFINKLIADGAADRAYVLWLNSLSEAQLARAGYLYNGDFEADLARQGPFDWTVVPAKNTVTKTVAGDRGMVLEVAFADSRISYRNLFQRLMLPPGNYTLTGSFKATNLQNDRGLVWRISCAMAPRHKLGQGPAMRGTQDWTPFEVTFSVPEQGCLPQLVRLELDARAKLDWRVTGVLKFDDLRIDRRE